MSYLDAPRFSFAGTFHADPPTRNNDLRNYDPSNTIPFDTVGDWNSRGSGAFWFWPSRVQSATGPDGPSADDPLIGAELTSRPHGGDSIPNEFGSAKIVDLDTNQRRLSTIYGLNITLSMNDGEFILHGVMNPVHFRDYWNQRAKVGSGGMPASTVFQSTITNLSWNGDFSRSRILTLLHKLSPSVLSIKFNVDQFNVTDDLTVQFDGRLTGTIGPYFAGEPEHYVDQRRLVWTASSRTSEFWAAPSKISRDRRRLVLDLGNSVQVTTFGGPSINDAVYAAILPNADDTWNEPQVLGTTALDTSQAQLKMTAGIVDVEISKQQASLLKTHRIGLLLQSTDLEAVLAEHPSGKYIDVEQWLFRVDPGGQAQISIRAFHLGQPLAGEVIPFYCSTQAGNSVNLPPEVIVGNNSNPMMVTTDKDGKATLTIDVASGHIANLPAERKFIDSQVYSIGDVSGWQEVGMVGPPMTPAADQGEIAPPNLRTGIVSILVFNTPEQPIENPTWDDVRPILERYAKLYPAMNSRIALDNPQMVRSYLSHVVNAMSLDRDDPKYMPVTRDLSEANRQLILAWLKTGK